jgi:KAP family P-loop domain
MFEASMLFIIGWLCAVLLNGSLPHTISGYSHRAAQTLLVWGGAVVVFVLSTLGYSLVEAGLPPFQPASDDLMDVPITDDSQDILGRVDFVESFYSQIERFPSEDSFVFGLNGPWGSGKTSALNLLRNRIRMNRKLVLVDFNPWYFQSAETITRRFYESISASLNRDFFYPQLRSIVRRYARILSPVLKRFGIESIHPDDATVEEIKTVVESYIMRTGRRVIVIIDDLERAYGSEVLTIFQIVRLSANFKNTLFVLAYDEAQLLPQLERLHVSREFLGKIVQHPTDLPAAEKNEIDRFVLYSDPEGHRSQLDRLFDKLNIDRERRERFDGKSVELYLATLSPFFSTLRNAKRFLTSFSVRLPAVVDEVYLLDFFLLEILRVFANRVHQDIWNKQYFYIPGWTTKSMMSSPFGLEFADRQKDLRREEIRKHVEDLLKDEPHKENILKILKELFPVRVSEAFGHPASFGDNAAGRFRAEKRLTHPESFEKYFLLAVPKGVLPDAAVEAKLASWLNAQDHEKKILEDLKGLSTSHKLVEALDRILVFRGKIDQTLVIPLLKAISRNLDSVPLGGDESEQSAQLRLILFLLSDRVADVDKQAATEDVVNRICSIDVAVRFVTWLCDSQAAVTWGLQRSLEISRIKNLVQERFSKEFVNVGKDVFLENANPLFVLYQIGTYNPESAGMINIYTMAMLEKKPNYIGKLIDAFFFDPLDGHGPRGFQFDNLKAVYDSSRLAELTKEAGEKAWASEKQRRAIDSFLRLMEGRETEGETSES